MTSLVRNTISVSSEKFGLSVAVNWSLRFWFIEMVTCTVWMLFLFAYLMRFCTLSVLKFAFTPRIQSPLGVREVSFVNSSVDLCFAEIL